MSPLIRKELRLILPFWGIAILLAVLPAFIVPGDRWMTGMNEIIYWSLGFGAILLGLASFGQEFSLGTFPALLAQPLERRQMWKTKFWLVLLSAFLVMLAFLVAAHFRLASDLQDSLDRWLPRQRAGLLPTPAGLPGNTRLEDVRQSTVNFYHAEFWFSCLGGGALVLLVGIAGGFWTSLVFRQTGAALWFAILIPGAILVAAEVVGHLFLLNLTVFLVPAFAIYIVAGFIWARRMFLTAQDAQWLGGTISLFNLSPAKPQTESATVRRRKPVAVLLRKEFQSHQVSLLIAFGLLVLHLATLVARRFRVSGSNAELWFALEAVPRLWLFLPWVIGSVAVAEERKLGTMESQLCLPATRRLQFTVKFLVTLFLGVVLGGLIPCLVEGLGALGGVSSEMVRPHASMNSDYFASLLQMGLGAGLVAFVSFYASTLTRTTLTALGAAIPIAGVFIAIFAWIMAKSTGYDYSIWHGPLVLLMAVPVCIIVALLLSFSNYKHLHAGRRVWLRNFLVLSISLVCAGLAAAVIYQRPWELAVPLEPKHGPARLSGAVQPVICLPAGRVFVLLPDGRLWAGTDYHPKEIDQYQEVWSSEGNTNRLQKVRIQFPTRGMFLGGSNWVALAAQDSFFGIVALRSDGTLWQLFTPEERTNRNAWFFLAPQPYRIGSDNDWKSIAAGHDYFVGVKNDGTLWNWAFTFNRLSSDFTVPKRIGNDSDWARVFSGEGSPVFVKQNGDVREWIWQQKTDLEPISKNINGSDWLAINAGYRGKLVIRNDGSLWAWDTGQDVRFFGTPIPIHSFRDENNGVTVYTSDKFVRIGDDTDWAQVSGEAPGIFALKKNGRLLKNGTVLFSATLGRLSAYSDWIAINWHWNSLVALGADGTVSLWVDTRPWNDGKSVLAPTRRPLWSLNIFTDTKN